MFKKAILKMINFLGYDIYPLNYAEIDGIEHNSPEATDAEWKQKLNSDIKKTYETKERINFYKIITKFVCEKLQSTSNNTIGDWGCGTGRLMKELHKQIPENEYIGFDISDISLSSAQQGFPQAEYRLINPSKNKNKYKKHFDVLLCTEVLEHLTEPEETIKLLIDMTKSDGIIVITVPDARRDNFGGHIHFWSPSSWKLFMDKHLTKVDYKIISINNRKNILTIIKK